jgi:hypothetical protein
MIPLKEKLQDLVVALEAEEQAKTLLKLAETEYQHRKNERAVTERDAYKAWLDWPRNLPASLAVGGKLFTFKPTGSQMITVEKVEVI